MKSVIEKYNESKDRLLKVTFTTLFEYLFLLREISCSVLRPIGSQAMLYLAAAVSDFYIPSANMVSTYYLHFGWCIFVDIFFSNLK